MDIRDDQELAALRRRIDEVDGRLVEVLARRVELVRRVSALKGDEEAVRSTDRVARVLDRVAALARQHGTDVDVVLATYRTLIDSLTTLQLRDLRSSRASAVDE
jgi:isochorismate pyruvate lyase